MNRTRYIVGVACAAGAVVAAYWIWRAWSWASWIRESAEIARGGQGCQFTFGKVARRGLDFLLQVGDGEKRHRSNESALRNQR